MKHEFQNHISYNPETGVITRIDRKNSSGSIDAYGYLIVKIKGKQYKAHRLAWFMHYGQFPSETIDHINGNKLDNRICNLRDVSQSFNASEGNKRRPPNKETGVKGVYIDKKTKGLKAKFCTRINNKTHRFRDLGDAVQFRVSSGQGV